MLGDLAGREPVIPVEDSFEETTHVLTRTSDLIVDGPGGGLDYETAHATLWDALEGYISVLHEEIRDAEAAARTKGDASS